MSQFIDRLNSIAAGGTAPMGFRAADAKPKAKMLLVAHTTASAKTTGADAWLLTIPKTGAKLPKAKSGVPWGGWLKDVSAPVVKKLGEGGADFVVFPAGSASNAILEDEKLGKVVEVEADIEASLLKAVDGLPVDAVLVKVEKDLLELFDYTAGIDVEQQPPLTTYKVGDLDEFL